MDKLQNTMFRILFAVPNSTPTPILRFDLGCLSMNERIDQKKLNFLHHIQSLESESLANEIYNLQKSFNFPGLVNECRKMIKDYGLPDIIDDKLTFSKNQWKTLVKEAIQKKSRTNIFEEFRKYSKLSKKDLEKEKFELKSYIYKMKLRDARTYFRIRSSMIPAKMNMKGNPKFAAELWRCDDCQSMDSQSHILWCPAYAPLWEGKNLDDDDND